MQQQKRAKPATRMKWGALLLCLVVFGMMGCQQPTKPLLKETKTENMAQKPTATSSSKPAKNDKPSTGNGESANGPQNGSNSGSNQTNGQGEITYQ